ncbi:MAG: alpha/beta hydrolase [Pseudonocardiales bacterium]|nr:alpha/beta hydrolase [Pseudonocardiales bacterium]
MKARPRLVALLCAAVALLAACSQPLAGAPAAGEGAVPPPQLSRYYTQKLTWGPCGPYATTSDDAGAFAAKTFECARLTVPLDYAKPDATTATVAVLRQKASGNRIGSLLFNPGGPGASGMSLVASLASSLADSPLSQRFDLVGFDPRGVGASTPAIDCLTDADWPAYRADLDVDPSPTGVAQTEAENKQYAQQCAQRSGGDEVLANVGTRDAARDMDILRAALGDPKLTFLGYSYGTFLGTIYAEEFPRNVRAMVLDGAVNPTQSATDRNVDQYAGFQQAFNAYAADCAKSSTCPLGTDPAQATAVFQAMVRPLIAKPLAVGPRTLSYNDAVTGTLQALYLQGLWPALTKALTGLRSGDGRVLLALADLYDERGPDGRYSNTQDAFNAILCQDTARTTDRAVVADTNRRSNAAAPFTDPGLGAVGALDVCAFWPVPPTDQAHTPSVPGLVSTLVVSTTGDPATPYQDGVDLAKELGSTLVTYVGTQHTASLHGDRCIDEAVTAYLVDGTLPEVGTRCSTS